MNFLEGIFKYRRLIWEMTKRDLKNRYAGSYLGIVWSIVIPLLSATVYIVVFSMLTRGTLAPPYDQFPFALYYFSGFTPWLLFSETVVRNLGVIRSNASLVTKVSFPTQILPISTFFSVFVTHAVFILITLLLAIRSGVELNGHLELLPIYFLCLFLLTMGTSFALSSLAVFIPDLSEIVPVILTLIFFCTPVLYTPDLVLSHGSTLATNILITWNPFHYLVEGYRLSLLSVGIGPNRIALAFLVIFSAMVAYFGALTFKRLKSGFADVL